MDKFDRITHLHAILSSRRTAVPLEQLMNRLECSRATLFRAVNSLKDCLGAPVVFDAGGFRYENRASGAMYDLPGSLLTPKELQAVVSMQRLLEGAGDGSLQEYLGPFAKRLNELARLRSLKSSHSADCVIRGVLYEITNQLDVPSTDIHVIAPRIEVIGETLAARLKKEPQSIYDLSSREFEHLVADLLSSLGWEVTVTPATRDGGKDILAFLKTEFGRLLCLVEAKRYRRDKKVGVAAVRSLYGSFADTQATGAMLVTSSTFSSEARAFASKHEYRLSLRDYEDLVQWIGQYKGH